MEKKYQIDGGMGFADLPSDEQEWIAKQYVGDPKELERRKRAYLAEKARSGLTVITERNAAARRAAEKARAWENGEEI